MNYFELFGLPVAPTVDRKLIARKYFELQKQYHPDFYSQSDDNEKEDVLQKSASVNKAFKTFQDPDLTLQYFLQVSGIIETDEKYDLPPAFLGEMMEINEALTEDETAAKKMIAEYEESLTEDVSHILQNFQTGTTDGADLLKLKDYYYKKKYVKRILDRLGD